MGNIAKIIYEATYTKSQILNSTNQSK